MPDLEKQITEWRRQMLAAGIRSPVPLDELESHLREDVEAQMKLGLTARAAFGIAVQRIGQANALKAEFKKAGGTMVTRLSQLMGIACAVIACSYSLMILPHLFHHAMGLPAKMFGLAAVASAVVIWRYGYRFLPAIRDQRVRAVIGILCCALGIGWILFCIQFVPDFIVRSSEAEIPWSQFMALFLWAWTMLAILGGVAYGLERAADGNHVKRKEQYV